MGICLLADCCSSSVSCAAPTSLEVKVQLFCWWTGRLCFSVFGDKHPSLPHCLISDLRGLIKRMAELRERLKLYRNICGHFKSLKSCWQKNNNFLSLVWPLTAQLKILVRFVRSSDHPYLARINSQRNLKLTIERKKKHHLTSSVQDFDLLPFCAKPSITVEGECVVFF